MSGDFCSIFEFDVIFLRRSLLRSGTWMMTGNGVMHNGSTVIELYGQNLDRLQVGESSLHFMKFVVHYLTLTTVGW